MIRIWCCSSLTLLALRHPVGRADVPQSAALGTERRAGNDPARTAPVGPKQFRGRCR